MPAGANVDPEDVPSIQQGAEAGDPAAQTRLGALHCIGKYVPLDYAAAGRWFREAAKKGYAPAEHFLGVIYESGWGVARSDEEARKWFGQAAAKGHAESRQKLEALARRASRRSTLKMRAAFAAGAAAAAGALAWLKLAHSARP